MAEYVDDPDDGLPVEVVGAWAEEKHARLVAYVHASSAARKKFARSETAYIDLFCGPGRSKIRHKNRLIDGGAVAACRRAHERGAPFFGRAHRRRGTRQWSMRVPVGSRRWARTL